MTAYYNEIDPFAAKWLECLIKEVLKYEIKEEHIYDYEEQKVIND